MRRRFAVVAALAIVLIAPRLFAEELEDTGWVDIEASALQQVYDAEWISYQDIKIVERRSTKTDKLNVVAMTFRASNNTDKPLYFDIDLVALDKDEQILFVMTHSPNFWSLKGGATKSFFQEKYVIPGALEHVEKYRVRFLGVN